MHLKTIPNVFEQLEIIENRIFKSKIKTENMRHILRHRRYLLNRRSKS